MERPKAGEKIKINARVTDQSVKGRLIRCKTEKSNIVIYVYPGEIEKG